MPAPVKKIPDGYSAVTPYLTVRDAVRAIDFYQQAFGAEELMRLVMPGGKIGHAEIRIGGAVIMLHDENPEWGTRSPQTLGGTVGSLMLYVDDVDAAFARAVAAGATVDMPVADQFYGDRCGNVTDPFGHKWSIATHVEDVPQDEIERRAAKLFGGG
jgi:PhnB protein